MIDFLTKIKTMLSMEDYEYFITLSWQVWSIKNRSLHGEVQPPGDALPNWFVGG